MIEHSLLQTRCNRSKVGVSKIASIATIMSTGVAIRRDSVRIVSMLKNLEHDNVVDNRGVTRVKVKV